MMIDNDDTTYALLRNIKELGVQYALDDLGTGYSSLSYLKRFPIDIVKIDKSFIADCTDDEGRAQLVKAIVNMARILNLQVVAEGVKTQEQRDYLCNINCDRLQGFLFSPAISAIEFQLLLEQPNPDETLIHNPS
jgi:EAL domain-containing protein (putative c-di-GMP-specific phosphodiesterase class I)